MGYGGAALAAVSVDRAPCALVLPQYMEAHAREMELMLFVGEGVPTNLDVLQVVHQEPLRPRDDVVMNCRIIGASHCKHVEQVLPNTTARPLYAEVLACGSGVRQLNGTPLLHLCFDEMLERGATGQPIVFHDDAHGVHFEMHFTSHPFSSRIVLPRGSDVNLAYGFMQRAEIYDYPVVRRADDPVTQFTASVRCDGNQMLVDDHSLHDYPDTDPEHNVAIVTRSSLRLTLPPPP